eukprot:899789-Rhodomonas_salina.3
MERVRADSAESQIKFAGSLSHASYPGYGYRVLPDDKELQLPNNGEQTHLAVRRAPSPNPHSLATPSPRLGIRYFRRDHDDDDAELTVGNQSFLESEPRAPKHLRYVVPATSAGSRKQAGLIQVHFARPDDRSMIDVDGYWVLSGMIGDTALSGHCVLARSRVSPRTAPNSSCSEAWWERSPAERTKQVREQTGEGNSGSQGTIPYAPLLCPLFRSKLTTLLRSPSRYFHFHLLLFSLSSSSCPPILLSLSSSMCCCSFLRLSTHPPSTVTCNPNQSTLDGRAARAKASPP